MLLNCLNKVVVVVVVVTKFLTTFVPNKIASLSDLIRT